MRIRTKKIPDKERAWGLAWSDGNILIDPRQGKAEFLDTLVHEALHIAYPKMKERKVRKGAPVIAKALMQMKYHRG